MLRPRGVVAFVVVSCAALGGGCFWLDRVPPAEPVSSFAPPTDSMDQDGRVVFHTRLIEQPAGHDYLNRGLWADCTDPLPHELSRLHTVNGLRVGVISGLIPSEVERLGTSDAAVVRSMMRAVPIEQPKAVEINGPTDRCVTDAHLSLTGEPKPFDLTHAECVLVVSASPLADGKLRVRCEPQIRHSGTRERWRPTGDGTGFESQFDQPAERFPALAWEVSLDRHEVLVFGATDTPDDRLGQAFFFPPDPYRRKQRVLILQAGLQEATRPERAVGATAALVR